MINLNSVCPTCGKSQLRSLPQNSRYWLLVGKMVERFPEYSKKTWHEWFKDQFLPKIEIDMPDWSTRLIPMSTSKLPMHPNPKKPDSPDWETYTMKVEVWCAEKGVWLDDREAA